MAGRDLRAVFLSPPPSRRITRRKPASFRRPPFAAISCAAVRLSAIAEVCSAAAADFPSCDISIRCWLPLTAAASAARRPPEYCRFGAESAAAADLFAAAAPRLLRPAPFSDRCAADLAPGCADRRSAVYRHPKPLRFPRRRSAAAAARGEPDRPSSPFRRRPPGGRRR